MSEVKKYGGRLVKRRRRQLRTYATLALRKGTGALGVIAIKVLKITLWKLKEYLKG